MMATETMETNIAFLCAGLKSQLEMVAESNACEVQTVRGRLEVAECLKRCLALVDEIVLQLERGDG